MALRHRITYLRKEHQELVNLADRIEKALTLASGKDFSRLEHGLAQLRALEHGFAGIVEHCHSEDRIVESTFHHYLNKSERLRLDEEHGKIVRALAEFREELRFATVDRTMAMIIPGMDLVQQLRGHVVFEEGLLDRIARSVVVPRRPAKRKKTSRQRAAPPQGQPPKQKARGREEPHVVPYTMEPHPEL